AFRCLLFPCRGRLGRSTCFVMREPPEGIHLAPSRQAGVQPGWRGRVTGRLIVVKSPVLDEGEDFELDSAQLTIGRGGQNEIPIRSDEYAAAGHARFEARHRGGGVPGLGLANRPPPYGALVCRPRR